MPSTRPGPRRGLASGALVAAILAIAAFLPVVGYGFVYDDSWTVVGNAALDWQLPPLLRALLSGKGVAAGVPDATRPTMVLSLWIDRRLFGLEPAGYHLHSLLLYAVASSLSSLAVFAVTRRRTAALVGGALFALSPVHTEVVAAINYREDLLSGIAVLSACAYVLWPRKRPPVLDQAVLVSALLVVGLFAKESAVSALPILLAALCTSRVGARAFLRHRGPVLVLSGGVLLFAVWRAWLRLSGRDDVPLVLSPRGPVERLLRTARYLVRTTWDGILPLGASPEYAPEPAASPLWLVALLGLILAIVWLVRRRRTRAIAAGLAIALVAGLPTSPLVSPINETADRYAFVAVLGGAVLWGDVAARLGRGLVPPLRAVVLVLVAAPLVLLCHRTAAPWKDELSLFRAAAEEAPTSARAFTGLSRALRLSGDLDGADRAIEQAVRLDPGFLRARITRLYNTLARGDVVAARAQIDEIRRLGGERQVGFRQAVHCAQLPPDDAARCSRSPYRGRTPPIGRQPSPSPSPAGVSSAAPAPM